MSSVKISRCGSIGDRPYPEVGPAALVLRLEASQSRFWRLEEGFRANEFFILV